MLEDLLPLCREEAANFLDTCLLNEKLLVLEFVAVVRVIAHQKFGQVDARVESLSDTRVNRV